MAEIAKKLRKTDLIVRNLEEQFMALFPETPGMAHAVLPRTFENSRPSFLCGISGCGQSGRSWSDWKTQFIRKTALTPQR
jgi:hypothetical protein